MSLNKNGESISPQDIPKSKPSDAKLCVREDIDQPSLEILLKAYYGYLSDDPYEDLVQCFAAFADLGTKIERKFGVQVGYEFGVSGGKILGASHTAIRFLFNSQTMSSQEIQQRAIRRLEMLSELSESDRQKHLNSYLNLCEWYGLPIRSLYDNAMSAYGK